MKHEVEKFKLLETYFRTNDEEILKNHIESIPL